MVFKTMQIDTAFSFFSPPTLFFAIPILEGSLTLYTSFQSILTLHVTTRSQLCRYCPLWSPYSSWFCFSPGCVGEKASTHWREIVPYKHIFVCFPRRCGIPWNARPPFLGHYNPSPLRAHASSRVGPTLPARAWL